MASLFLVGGSATYDGVTNIFATTSGGAASVAAVTSSDDVTIDSNSGTTPTLTIGAAFSCNSLTINKSDGGVACDGSHGITAAGAVTLTAGTLNTNGQTCSWGSFVSTGAVARTVTLGASAISFPAAATWNSGGSNLTITANTATLTLPGSSVFASASGQDWNGLSLVFSSGGSGTAIQNGCTLAALTCAGQAVKTSVFTINGGNITVTGTCTLGGDTTQGVNRLLVQSNTVGTSRTITAAAYVITGDVDFQDINLAYSGGASWTNGGSAFIGDCGGNSGAVTTNATASATQTATGTASFTWSTHGWTSRVPLPQDDVSIPNAFVAGRTVTADMPRLGRTITFTCTGSPALNFSLNGSNIYGSLTLASGMSVTGSSTNGPLMSGRTVATLTSNGVSIGTVVFIYKPGTTLTLGDDLLAVAINHQNGTFDSAGKNVTLSKYYASNSGFTRALTGSGGTWTFTGTDASAGAHLWLTTGAGGSFTISGFTAIITFTDTSSGAKTFDGSGGTYGTLRHTATGTAALTITGANTMGLILDSSSARTVTIPTGTSITIPPGKPCQITGLITLASATPGTRAIIDALRAQPAIIGVATSSDIQVLRSAPPVSRRRV